MKKKTTKTFITIILSLISFVFFIVNPIYANDNEKNIKITKSIIANKIDSELVEFIDNHNKSEKRTSTHDRFIEYGGSFIDLNGKFHFLVKDDSLYSNEILISQLERIFEKNNLFDVYDYQISEMY